MKIANIVPIRRPFDITVKIPASKSNTNRVLLLGALCDGPVRLINPLISDDTKAMASCLNELGIPVTTEEKEFVVDGSISDVKDKPYKLNADLSGITIRFITALACIVPGQQTITGEHGLNRRPIGDLVDALRSLGADIKYLDKEGFPPLRVDSSSLSGSGLEMSGATSSQFLSALLMISPLLGKKIHIKIRGKQISTPYIDMTIKVMKRFGVSVANDDYQSYEINPQEYHNHVYHVNGDFSSASYFFAAAALNESKVTVDNLRRVTKQADKEFLKILGDMGSKVEYGKNKVMLRGAGVKPMKVNMEKCPDQAMTLAVLAAFADGETTIDGISSLRIKETERIIALEHELAKMGIRTASTEDSLTIYGGRPKGAIIDTYGDHRIAMAFAIAGTRLEGQRIINPGVVNKTFPSFWEKLAKITPVETIDIKKSNIVLIGMRGTGKSTLGRIIAKKIGMDFVDTDDFIEKKNNMNIKKAVEAKGWAYFRKLENEAIKTLSSKKNTIISTGGGAVLDPKNVQNLRKNGVVFMLQADPGVLAQRIRAYGRLPSLTGHDSVKKELEEVWQDRREKYFASADFIIDTSGISPNKVVSGIMEKLETI